MQTGTTNERSRIWPRSKSGQVLLLIILADRLYTLAAIHFGLALEANPVTITRHLGVQLLVWPAIYWAAIVFIEHHRAPNDKRWIMKYCFTLMAAYYCLGYVAMSYITHRNMEVVLQAREIAKQFVQ